jgi:hypothetical protein
MRGTGKAGRCCTCAWVNLHMWASRSHNLARRKAVAKLLCEVQPALGSNRISVLAGSASCIANPGHLRDHTPGPQAGGACNYRLVKRNSPAHWALPPARYYRRSGSDPVASLELRPATSPWSLAPFGISHEGYRQPACVRLTGAVFSRGRRYCVEKGGPCAIHSERLRLSPDPNFLHPTPSKPLNSIELNLGRITIAPE